MEKSRDAFRILSGKGVSLELIVAQTGEGLIGIGEEIPWHLPEDLRFFKERTLGGQLIMGRKTFANIVDRLGRPLPGRRSIVLSRSLGKPGEAASLPAAFFGPFPKSFGEAEEESLDFVCDPLSALRALDKNRPAFVIGGAQVYESFENWIGRASITLLSSSVSVPIEKGILPEKQSEAPAGESPKIPVYYNALERLQARGLQIAEQKPLSPKAKVLFLQA